MKGLRRLVSLLTVAALGAALIRELRKPADERTWRGHLTGVIPYDFRPPTPKRVRQTFWNPNGPFVTGQVFGVGWTVNVGRIARLLHLT